MTAGVSWIRELLCDAPIYGLSLPPRICDIRFIYLSVSVARYLDRPNIMRVSKRTRSTRETFDFAVNLSKNCIHYVPRIVEDSKKGSNVTDSIKESEQFVISPSWDCFFGDNDCNFAFAKFGLWDGSKRGF